MKEVSVHEALRECADKLWIARCDSKDEAFRTAAERACEMATAALDAAAVNPHEAQGVDETARDLLFRIDRIFGKPTLTGPMAQEAYEAIRAALAPACCARAVVKFPRLSEAMMIAAAEAHYGKKRAQAAGGIDGISMTVDCHDYTFRMMMRRMWPAIRRAAAIRAQVR